MTGAKDAPDFVEQAMRLRSRFGGRVHVVRRMKAVRTYSIAHVGERANELGGGGRAEMGEGQGRYE
jgi:hypothetical protein